MKALASADDISDGLMLLVSRSEYVFASRQKVVMKRKSSVVVSIALGFSNQPVKNNSQES